MKKNIWKVVAVLVAVFAVQSVFARPHHHRRGDDGRKVRLATDIVNLVKAVVTPPAPVVVTPAPVVTRTQVVVAPPAGTVITYGYYNNVYVPSYNGWYFYNNVWCWGGRGRRPPHPPAWRPPHRHHRAAPPPRRVAPPPRRVAPPPRRVAPPPARPGYRAAPPPRGAAPYRPGHHGPRR